MPIQRCSHGMAPGLDGAADARAHHHVVAGLEAAHEALQVGEVVGVVGVGHDDERGARFLGAAHQGAAVAAPRFVHDARPAARPRSPASRRSSRCRSRSPRPAGRARAASAIALVTQVSIVSASFRQGRMTDTCERLAGAARHRPVRPRRPHGLGIPTTHGGRSLPANRCGSKKLHAPRRRPVFSPQMNTDEHR